MLQRAMSEKTMVCAWPRISHNPSAPHRTPRTLRAGLMVGAGPLGRVYTGRWQGQRVAVKRVRHAMSGARGTACCNEARCVGDDAWWCVRGVHTNRWRQGQRVAVKRVRHAMSGARGPACCNESRCVGDDAWWCVRGVHTSRWRQGQRVAVKRVRHAMSGARKSTYCSRLQGVGCKSGCTIDPLPLLPCAHLPFTPHCSHPTLQRCAAGAGPGSGASRSAPPSTPPCPTHPLLAEMWGVQQVLGRAVQLRHPHVLPCLHFFTIDHSPFGGLTFSPSSYAAAPTRAGKEGSKAGGAAARGSSCPSLMGGDKVGGLLGW